MDFFSEIKDTTQNIIPSSTSAIQLQPGFYIINYTISTLLTTDGYIQITPSYNGMAHMEHSVYSRTGLARTTAEGSQTFIIEVKEPTNLTLTFNSNVAHTEGQLSLTIIKLERS